MTDKFGAKSEALYVSPLRLIENVIPYPTLGSKGKLTPHQRLLLALNDRSLISVPSIRVATSKYIRRENPSEDSYLFGVPQGMIALKLYEHPVTDDRFSDTDCAILAYHTAHIKMQPANVPFPEGLDGFLKKFEYTRVDPGINLRDLQQLVFTRPENDRVREILDKYNLP